MVWLCFFILDLNTVQYYYNVTRVISPKIIYFNLYYSILILVTDHSITVSWIYWIDSIFNYSKVNIIFNKSLIGQGPQGKDEDILHLLGDEDHYILPVKCKCYCAVIWTAV